MFGKFKEMIRDQSGVSVIFGALLLLSVFAVFLSAFLVTAVPAKIMADESAGNELLLSEILKLSENDALSGQVSFHSDYSTVQVIQSGGILFAADISVPPETGRFLKSGKLFDSVNDFDFYQLSSGALLFSCRYSQIPDCFYSSGESSLLLIQEDGSSFLKPPEISVRQNEAGEILFSMRGDVLRFIPSFVFGDLTTVNYRVVQTAEVHDFVSEIRLFYFPAETGSFLNDTAAIQKEKAFQKWMLLFENELNRNFPGLKTERYPDQRTLIISSDSLFEIDVTVREIEYSFP